MYLCMYVCVCMYVYTYVRTYVRMYAYVLLYACMDACMYVCTYVYVCMPFIHYMSCSVAEWPSRTSRSRACPTPSHVGAWNLFCVHANTQGIARSVFTDASLGFRRAGREPRLSAASSTSQHFSLLMVTFWFIDRQYFSLLMGNIADSYSTTHRCYFWRRGWGIRIGLAMLAIPRV